MQSRPWVLVDGGQVQSRLWVLVVDGGQVQSRLWVLVDGGQVQSRSWVLVEGGQVQSRWPPQGHITLINVTCSPRTGGPSLGSAGQPRPPSNPPPPTSTALHWCQGAVEGVAWQ